MSTHGGGLPSQRPLLYTFGPPKSWGFVVCCETPYTAHNNRRHARLSTLHPRVPECVELDDSPFAGRLAIRTFLLFAERRKRWAMT